MSSDYKQVRPGPSTGNYGPGFPGNTQSSPAQDTALPAKVNEGDPASVNVSAPCYKPNSTDKGTTAGVQSQAVVNKVGRGTKGTGTTAGSAPYGK